jgi:HPt (histidine-containing phosphotransfer) domain-containing protein
MNEKKARIPKAGIESTEAIDKTILASLRELQEEGESDIVEEIGGLFIKYAPDKISAIEKAAEKNDSKALMVAAHSLKSSSAYIGALRLSALSKELEEMGRSGQIDDAASKAKELRAEYERAKASLEKEMK